MEGRMDRDTILEQIERYEKLLAAVGDEAERRSILKLLEKERAKLEAEGKKSDEPGWGQGPAPAKI
jgi:hypothetical protein